MVPSRIDSPETREEELTNYKFSSSKTIKNRKPTIYLLEDFPAPAVEYCQTLFNTILPTDPEVVNWRRNATCILVREMTISSEDIDKSPKLRVIGKQGTEIDFIDQLKCAERRIPILNTPGVNAQSIAELVLTLVMAVSRQIRSISVSQAMGEPIRREQCTGMTVRNKSLGIIGMGSIGKAVAQLFKNAFNCTIYAYDPYLAGSAWGDIPHKRVHSIEEMLPQIDILTLHVPLTTKTRDLISFPQFKKMKSTAILINAARGGIVNEDDLIRALNENQIWGAGLDCHEVEPPTIKTARELWETGRVVSTPGIAARTVEAEVESAICAVDRVYKYLLESI